MDHDFSNKSPPNQFVLRVIMKFHKTKQLMERCPTNAAKLPGAIGINPVPKPDAINLRQKYCSICPSLFMINNKYLSFKK